MDALGAALSRVSEWSNPARPLMLIPDAAATLFAVRANPGIPARGTVAVCDFGGSGTNITLMDAAGDYQALAPTVRHHDFSGDLIDQTLLTTVMANMASTGVVLGDRLAEPVADRMPKRQGAAVVEHGDHAADELPGMDGDIRLTRNELDDAIRASLNSFVAVLDETLARNGIRDLVAVVSVGGGANIPAVTTTLSRHLRVPVVTTPRPELTAAIGGALRAARGPGDTSATASAPAAPVTATAAAATGIPLVASPGVNHDAAGAARGRTSGLMPHWPGRRPTTIRRRASPLAGSRSRTAARPTRRPARRTPHTRVRRVRPRAPAGIGGRRWRSLPRRSRCCWWAARRRSR